jgi:hypothetical protein
MWTPRSPSLESPLRTPSRGLAAGAREIRRGRQICAELRRAQRSARRGSEKEGFSSCRPEADLRLGQPPEDSMTLSISRVLSLIVVAASCLRAWSIPSGLWLVFVITSPALALIWFPKQIDDITFGAWYRGYQIDSHTPGVLIAAMGWMLLLLFALALFLKH